MIIFSYIIYFQNQLYEIAEMAESNQYRDSPSKLGPAPTKKKKPSI